jgi:hypothetical protein
MDHFADSASAVKVLLVLVLHCEVLMLMVTDYNQLEYLG